MALVKLCLAGFLGALLQSLVLGRASAASVPIKDNQYATVPLPVLPQLVDVWNTSCDLVAFRMPLDHFNKSTGVTEAVLLSQVNLLDRSPPGTFNLVGYVCGKYWKPGGPIFVRGGNGRGLPQDIHYAQAMLDYGRTHNGLVVFVDRRYFGYSIPDELRYGKQANFLTFEQTVEDLAALVEAVKAFYDLPNMPAIYFGTFSPLPVLLRLRRPDAFIGVVSEGPYPFAYPGMEPAWNPDAYGIAMTEFARRANPNCPNNIRANYKLLEQLAQTPEGRAQINEIWNLCPEYELEAPEDWLFLRNFIDTIIQNIGLNGNTAIPDPLEFNGPQSPYLLAQACDNFLSQPNMTDDELLVAMNGFTLFNLQNDTTVNLTECQALYSGKYDFVPNNGSITAQLVEVKLLDLMRSAISCSGEELYWFAPYQFDGVQDMFYQADQNDWDTFLEGVCLDGFEDFYLREGYDWGNKTFGPQLAERLAAETSNIVFLNDVGDTVVIPPGFDSNISDTVLVYNMPYSVYQSEVSVVDYPELRFLRQFVSTNIRRWIAEWSSNHTVSYNGTAGQVTPVGFNRIAPSNSTSTTRTNRRRLQDGAEESMLPTSQDPSWRRALKQDSSDGSSDDSLVDGLLCPLNARPCSDCSLFSNGVPCFDGTFCCLCLTLDANVFAFG